MHTHIFRNTHPSEPLHSSDIKLEKLCRKNDVPSYHILYLVMGSLEKVMCLISKLDCEFRCISQMWKLQQFLPDLSSQLLCKEGHATSQFAGGEMWLRDRSLPKDAALCILGQGHQKAVVKWLKQAGAASKQDWDDAGYYFGRSFASICSWNKALLEELKFGSLAGPWSPVRETGEFSG